MHITPERFINTCWTLPLDILNADSEQLNELFLCEIKKIAKDKSIDVYHLDFNKYDSLGEAVNASENQPFIKVIEQGTVKPTLLLLFENCEWQAPLSCSLTFTIRTLLTTRHGGVRSLFIANSDALLSIFHDSKAAFYHSSKCITRTI